MKEIQARASLQLRQICSQIEVQDHIKQLQFQKLYLKHLTFVLSLCKDLYIFSWLWLKGTWIFKIIIPISTSKELSAFLRGERNVIRNVFKSKMLFLTCFLRNQKQNWQVQLQKKLRFTYSIIKFSNSKFLESLI